MILLNNKKYLHSFLFIILFSSVCFGQSIPYLSAPVNGSTWELTTPTLYWWYVPTPYSYGPFTYDVQVSTDASNFTVPYLLVDADVSSSGVGAYPISTTVGLLQGVTYYWRVGVGGNWSYTWSFTPYNYGTTVTYNITATAGDHGTISPNGSMTVARGSSRTFTINPDPGYAISDLIVDGTSVGATASFAFTNITASHTLRASFEWIPVYDTLYVSMLGSDSDGDGSIAKPYRKIQRGHDKSAPNQFVYVLNGTYEEDVVLTKPIKIIGETNPSTRSFLIRANDITIKNFNVTQSSMAPGIQKVGLESYDYLENLTLENVNSYNNAEMGLLLENMDNIVVKNCLFYGNAMGGITLLKCKNVKLSNIGLDDNLRGLAAYNSDDITIDQLYAQDNGKAYLALWPDKNGITFSICNNLSLAMVTANRNAEQGIKFEDCSKVTLDNVSANNNTTDGIAFIESDQITYKTGTATKNGTTLDDNGIEIIACENVSLSDVAANENFNTGILFDLFYYGVYKWDPTKSIPSPLPTKYIGPTTYITFKDVTAEYNGKHGLYGIHFSNGTFTNLSLNHNGGSGFEMDAAHHIYLVNGSFDYNNKGIVLHPTINTHPVASNLSTDEITNFSLTGIGSISNNIVTGLVVAPDSATKVTAPLFYGKFNAKDNGISGINISGRVIDPIFSGFYLKGTGSTGMVILDGKAAELVSGVKISDSYFEGYDATVLNASATLPTAAITLQSAVPAASSVNDVDAKNNAFVGAGDQAAVNKMIHDQLDNPALGLVYTDDWTSGQPTVKIGSASAYTGSLVTIPVKIDISALPLAFSQLRGKITFNELHLKYKYTTCGAGTIINDAAWGIIFNHSTSDQLKFIAFGFNEINSSGVLFYVTFEVVDVADGAEPVSAITADWITDGIATPFVINNGTITYSESTSKSIVKGDATLDFVVNTADYIAVINHINGISLTGQAFLNADVNGDSRVDALDAADILAYINTTTWPASASPAMGELAFASSSVDQEGLLRFPITFNNSSNLRSLQVELTFDNTKLEYRNFIQLMQSKNVYVETQKISDGAVRLIFASGSNSSGNLVPAELFFNLKDGSSTAGLIKSAYSVNGGTFKEGPSYGSSTVTDVEADKSIPTEFAVEQNYPNPFNPTTTITYSIPKASLVTVRVYDVLGRLVNTLVNDEMTAGKYQVKWNGDNHSGAKVSSGTYFYQVKSGDSIISKKMLLIK
jgi:hypothetical protein